LHQLEGKPLSAVDLLEKSKSIFSDCDLNSDGKITEEEFLKSGADVAEMFELADSDE
jgi:hypothetical protein